MAPIQIYLHIPYCVKKCAYCDFLSFPVLQNQERTGGLEGACPGENGMLSGILEAYLSCLLGEMEQNSFLYKDRIIDTVFIGGGTPSLLSPKQCGVLMDCLFRMFCVAPDAEITIEANPGTLTEEKLKSYRSFGINRLSIGLQSADNEELALLGRIHTFEEFLGNYEQARKCGFDNINIDLISGLPGQTTTGWRRTLKKVAKLQPEHISAYGLIIEEGTPFYERYGAEQGREEQGREERGREERGRKEQERDASVTPEALRECGFMLPSEEEERQMYHETTEILNHYGYRQYEISNYARPGYECRHNIGYWTRKEYVGFGLGAASLVGDLRWKNTSDLEVYSEYMAKERTGGNKEADGQTIKGWTREKGEVGGQMVKGYREDVQKLSIREQMDETMFLGLRMNRGVSRQDFLKTYRLPMENIYGEWLDRMFREKLLLDGERISLSKLGRDLANYVMAGFLGDG